MNLGSKHDMFARKFRVCDFNISLYKLQQHNCNKINKDDAIFLMQLFITNDADSKYLYKQIDACEIDGILHNYVNLTMLMDKVEAYIDYLQSAIDWQDRYNSLKDNLNKEEIEEIIEQTKAEFLNEEVVKESDLETTQEQSYAKGWNACNHRWIQTLKECLSKLQVEPCEDTISRADAVRVASGYCHPSKENNHAST